MPIFQARKKPLENLVLSNIGSPRGFPKVLLVPRVKADAKCLVPKIHEFLGVGASKFSLLNSCIMLHVLIISVFKKGVAYYLY